MLVLALCLPAVNANRLLGRARQSTATFRALRHLFMRFLAEIARGCVALFLQDFNRLLGSMSEHYDIPRVGPG